MPSIKCQALTCFYVYMEPLKFFQWETKVRKSVGNYLWSKVEERLENGKEASDEAESYCNNQSEKQWFPDVNS